MNQLPNYLFIIFNVSFIFYSYKVLFNKDTLHIEIDENVINNFENLIDVTLYKKLKNISTIIFFVLVILLTIFSYYSLISLANLRISLIKNVIFTAKPFVDGFYISAFFLAMLFSLIIYFYLLKSILKNKSNKYYAIAAYSYITNFGSLPRIVYMLLIILISISSIGFINWFTIFKKEEILINNSFGIGYKEYRYNEVKKINQIIITEENNNSYEYFEILFEDGYRWSSENDGYKKFNSEKNIINFIKKSSKVELITIDKKIQ